MKGESLIDEAQRAQFERDGFLLLPGFYDVARDIEPIQRGIHQIIGLLIAKHALPIARAPFQADQFDDGFTALIAHDRRLGGEVYDAVKQIPAFSRLISSERNERLFGELRGTDAVGIAAGGSGVRIDNPGEKQFQAGWHQEYPFQLRSLDGIVFWSPLVPITPDLGPVQIATGSHREGAVPMSSRDRTLARTGAYGYNIVDAEERVARYPRARPLTKPGDLLVMDFLVLHASGDNTATRSRWSMQSRLFNFAEPTGLRHGWRGSFAAGVDLRSVHPELVID